MRIQRLIDVLLTLAVLVPGAGPVAAESADKAVNVLVVYHSVKGHTRSMAEAVTAGARSVPGAEVRLKTVAEAETDDLLWADAIAVGSPVYNANVTPEIQTFINSWPFRGAPMRDKVGGAFATGGAFSAGEEVVQLSILRSMLVFGMVVAGGPAWRNAFGAAAVTEEDPFDTGTVEEVFLEKGRGLGKRLASLGLRMRASALVESEHAYLGMSRPGTTPEVFAPGIISTEAEYEYGSVLTADGLEFFFGVDVGDRAEIRGTRFEQGAWTTPEILLRHDQFSFNDPFLSLDEQRLYFISDRPLADDGTKKKDYDIWYVERLDGGWSPPKNLGPPINTGANEYYSSFTEAGALYFASNIADADQSGNFDIYASPATETGFGTPVVLAGELNTQYYEGDPFVAYDGSYVIFGSSRPDGLGRGDLYVSFRNPDGTWRAARHMGEAINGPGHELCPFVTRDGRYFFYTSDRDIYWVDASIIESFR